MSSQDQKSYSRHTQGNDFHSMIFVVFYLNLGLNYKKSRAAQPIKYIKPALQDVSVEPRDAVYSCVYLFRQQTFKFRHSDIGFGVRPIFVQVFMFLFSIISINAVGYCFKKNLLCLGCVSSCFMHKC